MKFAFKHFQQLLKPIIILALYLTASVGQAASTLISNISTKYDDKSVTITMVLSQPTIYHYFNLTDPYRLAIDFDETQAIRSQLPKFSTTPWLKQMRVAPRSTNKQRMVLEFSRKIESKITISPLKNQESVEMSISLQRPSDKADHLTSDVSKIPQGNSKHDITPIKTADTYEASGNCINIIIDPGHGGSDPGAVSLHGTKEKNVTLAISTYLADLVNHSPGMCAHLTRSGDYFVSLRGRLGFARKKSADLFIAIHADMYKNPYARGATVFALSQRGATSEAARWLAHSENASDLLDAGDANNQDKDLQSVLMDISQNETINRSLVLGKYVLSNLDNTSKLHHTIVEQAGFVVLKSPDIPSILVETGFLSNSYEEALLSQSTYQKKIALAIYRGLMEYAHEYSLPIKHQQEK